MCLLRSVPIGPPDRAALAQCLLGIVTSRWAAASASSSLAFFAVLTARCARINSVTRAAFFASGKEGLARRQRRPFTTKYLPSGVTGC
jgi:hypothetical protein